MAARFSVEVERFAVAQHEAAEIALDDLGMLAVAGSAGIPGTGLVKVSDLADEGSFCLLGVFKDNVSVFPYDVPPPLSETLSWRQLWRSGGFALLDFVWDTSFSGLAADRGLHLGIGQRPLQALDIQGALQPIAFAAGGNPYGFVDLARVSWIS